MNTKFADVWNGLGNPFDKRWIKERTLGGKTMQYVTARTVMNRLDAVLGPENWWDSYQVREDSVECHLTIRLPDGSVLTKVDAGGYAGMSDAGDDDKSGYSDAFKRAAVKFGVGRHLYGDGIPTHKPKETTSPANGSGEVAIERPQPPMEYPPDKAPRSMHVGELRKYTESEITAANDQARNIFLIENKGDKFKAIGPQQVANHLVKWLGIDKESLKVDGRRSTAAVGDALNDAWKTDKSRMKVEIERYLHDEHRKAAEAVGIELADDDSHCDYPDDGVAMGDAD